MDQQLYKYTVKQINQAFPKYKKVQVGATIKNVEIKDGEVIKTIPMVNFKKVYNSRYGIIEDLHQLYVAVDQLKNTVYWNFELIKK
jgi:hypothetical protein